MIIQTKGLNTISYTISFDELSNLFDVNNIIAEIYCRQLGEHTMELSDVLLTDFFSHIDESRRDDKIPIDTTVTIINDNNIEFMFTMCFNENFLNVDMTYKEEKDINALFVQYQNSQIIEDDVYTDDDMYSEDMQKAGIIPNEIYDEIYNQVYADLLNKLNMSSIFSKKDEEQSQNKSANHIKRLYISLIFETIEDAITYAKTCENIKKKPNESALLKNKNDGKYYLIMQFNNACDSDGYGYAAIESKCKIMQKMQKVAYIKEHGKRIIGEDALTVLCKI